MLTHRSHEVSDYSWSTCVEAVEGSYGSVGLWKHVDQRIFVSSYIILPELVSSNRVVQCFIRYMFVVRNFLISGKMYEMWTKYTCAKSPLNHVVCCQMMSYFKDQNYFL